MGGTTMMRGFGLYDMVFAKDGATWRIKTLKLHYVYREEHHVYVDNVLTLPSRQLSCQLTSSRRTVVMSDRHPRDSAG
jgi:hypothetical protein